MENGSRSCGSITTNLTVKEQQQLNGHRAAGLACLRGL